MTARRRAAWRPARRAAPPRRHPRRPRSCPDRLRPPRRRTSRSRGRRTPTAGHTKGVKQFNHPIVGELELSFNRLEVSADRGVMIVAYTAEPGSRSADALGLLPSWAATEAGRPVADDPDANRG